MNTARTGRSPAVATRNVARGASGNGVLDRLPAADRAAVLARAACVPMARGEVLGTAQRAVAAMYFPLDGLVALVLPARARPALGVGLVGRCGMVGVAFTRDDGPASLGAVVQDEGLAWRVPAEDFARSLARRPPIRSALERALRDVVAQLASTANCTPFHPIEARLAGWLALAAARMPDRALSLTHQRLADLLGVRRSAITLAIGALRRRRLLDYSRGAIAIIDRGRLEAAGCGCRPSAASARAP